LNEVTPERHTPDGELREVRWFLFRDNRILIENTGADQMRPYFAGIPGSGVSLDFQHYLGKVNGTDCYAAELSQESPIPRNTAFTNLRRLLGSLDEGLLQLVGRANHLVHWARCHRFCGRCGAPTLEKPDEKALYCEVCGWVNYPRVSPAVIVAVVRQRRILLARSTRIRGSFHSVLAGFVEPGETLEACVHREVREETGIEINAIRYFGSQPWPFPDSLMVAFTAEYAAGEINVDPAEILDAGWFAADALPKVPGKYSIARRLIDWFAGYHM
jgi:NAD+ diphosphatase